jgi:ubiquinone/menaquinone biosynthesis C-methylase UbiE
MSSSRRPVSSTEHAALIAEQFSLQAADFAAAPELHNEAVLKVMIDAAAPKPSDRVLDVACGPGSVALAFAPLVSRVVGIDVTTAMLDQARAATVVQGIANAEWLFGSVYALPFDSATLDIVVSRFAIHHLTDPPAAFDEMMRVTANGGRIVLCDAVASDNPAKALAFNEMERFRDPSTVEFRRLDYLMDLFRRHSLEPSIAARFQVPYLAHEFVARAFPANNDRAGLLALIESSVDGDRLGMGAKRTAAGIHIAFQTVALVANVKR